ncbi:MAG: tetraacyldisaccharide 4'-kinase [Planctomycetaceae bacterium]|nr:tetraacyldisaccharide 4'-kinase [Planctomycetaceae bacterium]
MSEEWFKKLISGDSRNPASSIIRGVLKGCSGVNSLATRLRNLAYDRELQPVTRQPVPVVAIGNLTVGGTGKTPIVAYVVRELSALGRRPGIISRGYRADQTGTNDEKRVLDLLCPGVPHEQDPDRNAAAAKLLGTGSADVLVLDDAFQHRRIARQCDIVLIDATNPFGYGHLLPRGLLREPIHSLRRADVVLITRSDQVDESALKRIEATVSRIRDDLPVHRIRFVPTGLLNATGTTEPLTELAGTTSYLMTAIGNPEGFRKTCEMQGVNIAGSQFFPDHHHYTREELDQVVHAARQANASRILTTLKDLVKIPADFREFRAVQIETQFPDATAAEMFRNRLNVVVEGFQRIET